MTTTTPSSQQTLIDETANNLRTAAKYRFWGYPMIVITALYLVYVGVRFSREILDPYRVASAIAVRVDRNAPEMIENLKADLKGHAPATARRAHDHMITLVRFAGHAARTSIEQLTTMLPLLDRESKSIMDSYFANHSEEVRRAFLAHENDQFVADFVDALFQDISEKLRARVVATIDNREVSGPHEVSVAYLTKVNDTLRHLSSMSATDMSPRERLQRRLIVAWTGLLRTHMGVATFKDIGLNTVSR